MPEEAWASMSIYGKLPATLIDGLVEAIKEDGPGSILTSDLTGRKYLDEITQISGEIPCLAFEDSIAINAEFYTVENFCKEHSIPYKRVSNSCGEYDGEYVVYDGNDIHYNLTNEGGDPFLTIYSLQTTVEIIDQMFASGNPKREAALKVNLDEDDEREIWIRDYILLEKDPTPWETFKKYLNKRDVKNIKLPDFEILED